LARELLFVLLMMKRADNSILIVEDEKLLNWSLATSLAKWGFDARTAYSGTEALSFLEKSGFAVFLLDYQLPDVDGLQIARRIRMTQPEAIIFLVTAFQLNELTIDDGLIDAYFNKPLDLQQLHQALLDIPHRDGSPVIAGGMRPRN
jgi:DNA-binding response OmpR family regulator